MALSDNGLSAFDLVMEACEKLTIETDRGAGRQSEEPEVERSRRDRRGERNESRRAERVLSQTRFVAIGRLLFSWRLFFFLQCKETVRRDKEKERDFDKRK